MEEHIKKKCSLLLIIDCSFFVAVNYSLIVPAASNDVETAFEYPDYEMITTQGTFILCFRGRHLWM